MRNANLVAYAALLIWPAVSACLYARFPIGKATLWTILGGFLILPVDAEIKFAGIPALNKDSIPNLAALVCALFLTGRAPKIFRGFGWAELSIVVLLIGPFVTSMFNSDPIRIGITYLPGVGLYDALSASVAQFIYIVPFFLARQFMRRPEDNAAILRSLVVAGAIYSLPMLFEIRMSPQLHFWIYGYYSSDFIQEMRDGGFRPMVFLGHGLLVAFFAMTATVAAAALWRTRTRIISNVTPSLMTAYLAAVLVLCKTASATLYAALLVPLVRWASPSRQTLAASILVCIALTYPLLRSANLIPTKSILEAADTISANRAQSLRTRFDNEDQLLNHALQRPLFGWGRFGRNRVYAGWNGGDSSITDGHWIITLGQFGFVGFVAEFGLLGLTVFRAAVVVRLVRDWREAEYLGALALIVAINMIDLLPNSSIRPWTWLLAGALLGRAEAIREARQPMEEASIPTPKPASASYSSQMPKTRSSVR
jgi:hypothetical protein